MTSLISNALKYSPEGTTVDVSLAVHKMMIELRASDHGIGIPAQDVPNLFQPFHRGANINAIPGTGLGLSIAKNVVKLHGGDITVESVVGKGTTFVVKLPLEQAQPALA